MASFSFHSISKGTMISFEVELETLSDFRYGGNQKFLVAFPFPAPTSVWISSIKRMMFPSDFVTSLITDFRRSSNSPLYLAPATSAPISSENSCLFFKFSGTSPRRIRCASPSTIAVLPVPGSPIRIGLFFVRRLRICSTRRISSSRPITGSSFPLRAASIRLMAYLFND